MKLIITPNELRSTFNRLLDNYQEYYFATAWAGMPVSIIDKLIRHSDRIKKMVVGIHFYQTDPDFLDKFVDHKQLRTIMQPNGTFHPKVFLFYTSDKEWTLLVGSANFTRAAFVDNTEATLMITSKSGDIDILRNARKIIVDSWDLGKKLDDDRIKAYRLQWEKMRQKRAELSGKTSTVIKKATNFMMLSWPQFVEKFDGRRDSVNKRFEMLESIRGIFANSCSLINMSEDERKLICGNNNDLDVPGADRWADFGTSGNGQFMHKMISGNKYYSDALDQIPLKGEVTKKHFDAFLKIFLQDEDTTEGWVSSAGRLLALKRPDTFYNITNANRAGFCHDFAITQNSTKSLNNYWDVIVQKIQICTWYQNPTPKNKFEKQLRESRAAMLDVLYYF